MSHYVRVELNEQKIIQKVTNETFGLFVADEWRRLISPFTPHRNGPLENTAIVRPFEIEYIQPYSAYMYYGEVYVDPIYKCSGFTNDGGETWHSRKNVSKVPSGREFNYLKDPNIYATHHWDKAAENAGQKEKLIRATNKYFEK